jgi:hypothetical protein
MNETELRRGLDDAVAAGSPPLALDAAGMLAHARNRRRVRLAGVSAGSTVTAAAVALGVVLALPGGAASGGRVGAAGQPSGCEPAGAATTGPDSSPYPTKMGKDGKPAPGQPTDGPADAGAAASCPNPSPTQWPDAQTDRTARTGPHFQKGVALQAAVLDLVPAGYTTVEPYNQAQFADRVGSTDIWETQASVGIRRAGRTGTLFVENYNADRRPVGKTLCTVAAAQFDARPANCHLVQTGGKTVAITTQALDYNPRIEQWATYRDATGGLVFVAQSTAFQPLAGSAKPLTARPFTEQQLAAIAVGSRLAPG